MSDISIKNNEEKTIQAGGSKNAVNILRGVRKQDQYIPTRKLTAQQFKERFFDDARIDNSLKVVKDAIIEYEN